MSHHHSRRSATRLRRLHEAKVQRISRRHRPLPGQKNIAYVHHHAVSNQHNIKSSHDSQHLHQHGNTAMREKSSSAAAAATSASSSSKEHASTRNPFRRLHNRYKQYQETKFYKTWDKRPKFSYGAYLVIAFILVEIANMFLLWSVTPSMKYDPSADESFVMQIINGTYHWLANTSGILNFFALGILYIICVTVINRFWVGTAIFSTISLVFAIANKIKVTMRGEPIIPSDLGFLTGESGGEDVMSFVTDDLQKIINAGITLAVWFVIICFLLQFIDKRTAFIYCSWRHPIARPKNIFGTICRILAPILSIWLMVSYSAGLSTPDSGTRELADEVGYVPRLWNIMDDAQQAGTATTFLSLTRVKAMEEEPDYSKATMQAIAKRYEEAAQQINSEREATLTDNTVIMVLSETFSDPNRVPGVHFSTDPMPYIRSLGDTTTSGLMLSPGYGGGTANIEFQQMTGLSMANFSDSMLSPYQQLVPSRSEFFSFNQMWNQACGSISCSVGFHPFLQGFYLRQANYKKFGFSNFYTLDSEPPITHTGVYHGSLADSENVTDEEAYKNVLDEVRSNAEQNKPAQFIELITMQNHSPYPDLYGGDNEFYAANESTGIPEDEKNVIALYAKGVQRTDEATRDFLEQLDQIDKPITVVFYGDHLPGIYATASEDKANNLALHETDYFIWSNAASSSHDVKLPESNAAYSSSNYFMAQAAQQMNAKISPYLALLDELHAEVPAISRSSTNMGTWTVDSAPTYLNDKGEPMNPDSLSEKAQQLLADYKMVQYDITVGQNYLQDMGFMDLPNSTQ